MATGRRDQILPNVARREIRLRATLALAVAALVIAASSCTGGSAPAVGPGPAGPVGTGATGIVGTGPTGTGGTGATGSQGNPITGKDFDPGNFDDPTTIDNPWFPLQPGTRSVLEGRALDGEEWIERRVVVTVTDLTKVIAGVRTLVTHELDYNDGRLVESDLAFYAQDNDGNVWQLGEYPEEYERGEIVKAPAWIHGAEGARAGLTMPIESQLGMPSYAQGWGPAVGWNDRANTHEMGVTACVPVDCYADVLVIREFNRDEPGASQLKFYASGVGGVRVGWMGPNEVERERMVLVDLVLLSPEALADARNVVLEQDGRGYEIRGKVYGQTSPAEVLAS